jgi:hypothetical protein
MNAMTCAEVEGQLGLLAAGECDRPTRQAVERHLAHCPACAASYAESQRLLGLLALELDQAGPERVRQRIEREERQPPRRPALLPFVRRVAAVAALFLLAVGLSWWLRTWPAREGEPDLQLAALAIRGDQLEMKANQVMPARATGELSAFRTPSDAEPLIVALPPGQRGGAFRRELLQAERDGKLPPPPALPLALALKNAGARPLVVRVGDAATGVALDVYGPGVVRLPASAGAALEFLQPRTLRLAPGEQYVFRIDRLIAGAPGRWEYVYLTEPGAYTLVARLRVTADDRVVTVASEPIRVKVGD